MTSVCRKISADRLAIDAVHLATNADRLAIDAVQLATASVHAEINAVRLANDAVRPQIGSDSGAMNAGGRATGRVGCADASHG
jgi:hypothetical protein